MIIMKIESFIQPGLVVLTLAAVRIPHYYVIGVIVTRGKN